MSDTPQPCPACGHVPTPALRRKLGLRSIGTANGTTQEVWVEIFPGSGGDGYDGWKLSEVVQIYPGERIRPDVLALQTGLMTGKLDVPGNIVGDIQAGELEKSQGDVHGMHDTPTPGGFAPLPGQVQLPPGTVITPPSTTVP